MSDPAGTSRILTLVCTDLADSTALKTQRGDQIVGELITRHRAHVQRLAAESGGRIIDWAGDGWIQIIAGDPEAGIALSERARRLSPQGPTVAQVEDNLAMAYFETSRSADALEAGRKLVALRPAYVWGCGYVAMNAAALGRVDEARAAVSEARRVEPRVSLELFQRGIGVSRPEIDARRNAALRQAGLE